MLCLLLLVVLMVPLVVRPAPLRRDGVVVHGGEPVRLRFSDKERQHKNLPARFIVSRYEVVDWYGRLHREAPCRILLVPLVLARNTAPPFNAYQYLKERARHIQTRTQFKLIEIMKITSK